MKKIFIISTFFALLCAIAFSSCGSLPRNAIVPTAINTVNSVTLNELNLEREDYKILNTISADATIMYIEKSNNIIIKEANNEFSISYGYNPKTFNWYINKVEGIARYGFLTNDYKNQDSSLPIAPETIARNLAIYRLINACKAAGGDGVIEPIVSTNVGQEGNAIIFKTTVSAKTIKINTDK